VEPLDVEVVLAIFPRFTYSIKGNMLPFIRNLLLELVPTAKLDIESSHLAIDICNTNAFDFPEFTSLELAG